MRHIDEDTITQAVIARHAAAGDARLRDVVTSLVQHLHGFARDVKLTEAEWAEGTRFLADCGVASAAGRSEVTLLSDALGLTALVTAVNQRRPRGCTESSVPPSTHGEQDRRERAPDEPLYVCGRVRALDGSPIAGAQARIGSRGGRSEVQPSGSDGSFICKTTVAAPQPVAHDGPVGRLLQALGRPPWRPAHLHITIDAPGYEPLATQLFRQGDPYLDVDAVFGVRSSLVADWVCHEPGATPDGDASAVPFTTLDFDFVLNATTGDKR